MDKDGIIERKITVVNSIKYAIKMLFSKTPEMSEWQVPRFPVCFTVGSVVIFLLIYFYGNQNAFQDHFGDVVIGALREVGILVLTNILLLLVLTITAFYSARGNKEGIETNKKIAATTLYLSSAFQPIIIFLFWYLFMGGPDYFYKFSDSTFLTKLLLDKTLDFAFLMLFIFLFVAVLLRILIFIKGMSYLSNYIVAVMASIICIDAIWYAYFGFHFFRFFLSGLFS